MHKNKKKGKRGFFLLSLIGIFGSFLGYSCAEPLCVVPSSDNNRELSKNALIECNELPNIFDTNQNATSTLVYKQYYNNEEQSIFTLANLYDKDLFSISGGKLANSENKIKAIRLQVTLPTIDSSDEKAYTIPIPIIDGAINASNTTASLQTVNNVRTLFFGLTDDLQKAIKKITPEKIKISIDYTIQYINNVLEDNQSLSFEVTKKSFTDIYTWQDLQAIQHNLDNTYTIKNNITFPNNGTNSSPVTNFIPIGNAQYPFTGNLDGGGNTISGLFIENTANNANIGLFGVISDSSTIKNITFSEVNVTGSGANANVGALAGTVMGGTLTGIKVQSGTIKGTNAGGLIGTIANTATVKLVGYNSDDSKQDLVRKGSGATITAVANGSIGGLVGAITAKNTVTITGYSTAIVQGSLNGGITGTNIGGLIGSANSDSAINEAITIDGYTYGRIKSSSTEDNTGGLLGVTSNASLELRVISYSTVLGVQNQKNLGWFVGFNNSSTTIHGYWLDIQGADNAISPKKTLGKDTGTSTGSNTKVVSTISKNRYNFGLFTKTTQWIVSEQTDNTLPILQHLENSTNFFGNQLFRPSYTSTLKISYRTDNTSPLTRGAFYDSNSFTISNSTLNMQERLALQLTYSYTTNENNVVSSSKSYTTTLASNTDKSNSIILGLKDIVDANTLLSTTLYTNLSTITNIIFTFIITENSTNIYRGEIEIPVDANAIYTTTDLQSMQYKLDSAYKLYTNITLQDPWTPIGNANNPFTGSLQGWDSGASQSTEITISNFFISNSAAMPVGLFGVINSTAVPTLQGITIELAADSSNKAINNNNNNTPVGAFAGKITAGVLKDLTVKQVPNGTSSIKSTKSNVGGIVGQIEVAANSTVTVTNVYNNGVSISGANYVGGLVGSVQNNNGNNKIIITGKVETNVAITGNSFVGGLLGASNGTKIKIYGWVKDSTVTSTDSYTGGLVGQVTQSTVKGYVISSDANNKSTIKGNHYVGGLVGQLATSATLEGYVHNLEAIANGKSSVGSLVGQIDNSNIKGFSLNSNPSEIYGSASGSITVFSATNIATSSNNDILTIKNEQQQTESVEFTLGSDIGSWKLDNANKPPLINIVSIP